MEISVHAANGDAGFQKLYRKVARRRGVATAKVAVARKLLTVVYAMLKNNEPFRGPNLRQRTIAKAWSKKRSEGIWSSSCGHGLGASLKTQVPD